MTRKIKLPTNESGFFQLLREETLGSIFWERLELKTDSGFPDAHFVLREPEGVPCEGTCEFKFYDTKQPNLRSLMEASQIANFLEYSAAGGRRRFLLACNGAGRVSMWNTTAVTEVLLGKRSEAWSICDFFDDVLPVRNWLPTMLEM